jgi:diaminopimelate decarboxylase
MDNFTYIDGELHADGVPLSKLADEFGTPLYVYSLSHLRDRYNDLAVALKEIDPLICYSVKANSNKAVLEELNSLGSGFDIVSGGELFRALKAGADASKIVYAGVGKTADEIDYAIKENILFFTVESEPEAREISKRATALGQQARIAFRINPDVDPKTHKYISTGKAENKFGLDIDRTFQACEMAAALPNIEVAGLHMHIGSQLLDPQPFADALAKIAPFCASLKKKMPSFKYLDIGGGLGIKYEPDHTPIPPAKFAETILPHLRELGLKIVMEPGRFIAGNAGVLLGRVLYIKDNPIKKFVVADTSMTDLLRPALYEAHHEVLAVKETEGTLQGDLVGPVCESGDFIAKDRELPAFEQGDLLAVLSAGAYGFTMASNYNSRLKPAEVVVDGDTYRLARQRDTLEDIIAREQV